MTTWTIFSDEVYGANPPLSLGALACPATEGDLLRRAIRNVRRRYPEFHKQELKANKVSRSTLPMVKDVCATLKETTDAFFLVARVRNVGTVLDGRAPGEPFFSAYARFLSTTASRTPGDGTTIILQPDHVPHAATRWADVKKAATPNGRKLIMRPWNPAKGSALMQLTDLLLGALASQTTAPHKTELRDFIRTMLTPGRLREIEIDMQDTVPTKESV